MTRRNSLALHLTALAALSSVAQLPVLVGAEDLDAEDVPPECVAVCAPIVALTARCEAQTEQRFGDVDKRFFHDDGMEARRRHVLSPERIRRRRQRLEERMRRRQVQSDSDSDSSADEAPPQVVAAAEREEKECVCQDTSFDVFGAMNGCAGCIAANVTAVEANEEADLRGRYQGDHGRLRVCSSTPSSLFLGVDDDYFDDITATGNSHGPSGRESGPRRILDVSPSGISARGTVYLLNFINILNGAPATTTARCPDLNATAACCRDDAGARGDADGGELNHARDGVRDAFIQDVAQSRAAQRLCGGQGRRSDGKRRGDAGEALG
ncbi:hypothetical protein GCG54_00008393 [Colletotrichum gloeosporioides]|uniref:Uncharacterized protein n=1 Tax=Colletotrichum gloeosporioides TaxID=474922 RepID=A0A8H4CHC7_COLGL|nr:uncharacterized protein GCG54_00008393 [Colletotrichum gloeosporioides]KAF3803891.1 hypothetical protein GCG54_00008393 [Colletotrichum gloeosporioides]